jgi:hypothetical protein
MEENNTGWRGAMSWYYCFQEIQDMNNCVVRYIKDDNFNEECKQIYLDRRSKYRETGVIQPDPYYKKKYYIPEREIRKEKFREEYEKKKKEETI